MPEFSPIRCKDFDFVALDVETANSNYSSICQVGLAFFKAGAAIDSWKTLVNPQTEFSDTNIRIHGITKAKVRRAPSIPEALDFLRDNLTGQIIVHHSPFDKSALCQATDMHNQPRMDFRWLDTIKVAREAWPEHKGNGGYGLAHLTKQLNITFQHHDACEDARATGLVLVKALAVTGDSVEDWVDGAMVTRKVQYHYHKKPEAMGNPNGPLYGHTAVFTGYMMIPRERLASIAAQAGCDVKVNVTKKTTILIVGDQDPKVLAGHEKSSKHRKAEKLIAEGQEINILNETQFYALLLTCEEEERPEPEPAVNIPAPVPEPSPVPIPQEIDIETPKRRKLNIFDWMRVLWFKRRRLFWLVTIGTFLTICCAAVGIFALVSPSPADEPAPVAEELTVEQVVAQMQTEQAASQPTLAPTATPEPLYWDANRTYPAADPDLFGEILANKENMTDLQFKEYLNSVIGSRIHMKATVNEIHEDGEIYLSSDNGGFFDSVYLNGVPKELLMQIGKDQIVEFDATIRSFEEFLITITYLDDPVIYSVK